MAASPGENQISAGTHHSPSRREATLKLVLLSLIPVIFLCGAVFFFYVFVKLSHPESVLLGIISSTAFLLLLRPISGLLDKLFSADLFKRVGEATWKRLRPLLKSANRPVLVLTVLFEITLLILALFYVLYHVFDPYTGRGRIALNDSWSSDTTNMNRWGQDPPNQPGCHLKDDGFHVSTALPGDFHFCVAQAADRFENFVYEVQVRIVTGDCAALLFRADPVRDRAYYFDFCSDGSYDLIRYDSGKRSWFFGLPICHLLKDQPDSSCILASGMASEVFDTTKQEADQWITVAVIADGTSIDFDVYSQHLGRTLHLGGYDDQADQAYVKGYIGVAAGPKCSNSPLDSVLPVQCNQTSTNVTFRYAKVWQL